jgi:hypothetical protein
MAIRRVPDSCRHIGSGILRRRGPHISFVGAPRRWPFAGVALLAAVLVAGINYAPILQGKVPLPTDLFGWFPAWEGADPRPPASHAHAEEGDLLTLMYPWRAYLAQSFRSGSLPYWNPHIMLGTPFLANPISAVFYPPNGLFALLPTTLAWSLEFPLRAMLAVFFAALFARRIGSSRTGAILAAVAFALSGFMTAWQGWPQTDCLVWAPPVMLAFLALRRRPDPRRSALLGLAAAMPLLAGHPEVCLYTLAIGAGFGLLQLVLAMRRVRSRAWAGRYLAGAALGLCFALGVSAAQLVPTIEWLPRITRSLDVAWASFPRRDLVALVSRDASVTPNSAGIRVPEECAYVGIGVLLLTPLALAPRRRAVAVYFWIVALASAGVAYGFPPAEPLFRAVPILRGLPGTRLIGTLDLSLALLGGLGLTVLQQPRRRGSSSSTSILMSAVGVLLTAALLLVLLSQRSTIPASQRATLVVLSASSTLLLAIGAVGTPRLGFAAPILAALAVADLIGFSQRHVPMVPAATVFPAAPGIEFLKTRTRPGERVLFLKGSAFNNLEMVYDLDGVGGYPQVLKETAARFAPLNGGTDVQEPLRPFESRRVLNAPDRLLDRLGVRFVVANGYAERRAELADLQTRFPLRLRGQALLIYENPSAESMAAFPPGPDAAGGGAVWNVRQENNDVAFDVRTERRAVLRILQTFYPGWSARVDGAPAPVERSSDGFCQMTVPEGRHTIRLRFVPTGFAVASAVSGVCLVLMAFLVLGWAREHGRTWDPRRGRAQGPDRRRRSAPAAPGASGKPGRSGARAARS